MTSIVEREGLLADASAASWWRQRWGTLAGGFAAAVLVGVACAVWCRSGADWDHGLPWERTMLVRLHVALPRALDALMLLLPWFGTNISLMPGIALLAWWLWVKRRRVDLAMRVAVVQAGSYLLNPSLKAMFDRQRPDLFPRRGWYGWSSFPSGHSIASVSVLVTVAIVIHRATGRRWAYYVALPIMLASMYSRLYLAVHWPTDVFAGALVGLVWLAATTYAFRPRDA